ncbi:MAG: antibiotic biosynthesis monooxygenase [Actinomycetota bacterium]|nr:antibiotic biosynthesis monooxygenase [Actinomycetota bacterium]
MIVRMWEAKVLPGEMADALDWLREEAVPAALAQAGCLGAEGFEAVGDERIVVISRWADDAGPWEPPRPYRRLLRRSHTWPFRPA